MLAAVLLASAVPAGAARAATTRFASPTGSGSACTEGEPCTIAGALTAAVAGDSVQLAPGNYVLPPGGISVAKAVSFGGAPGAYASTVLETTSANNFRTNSSAKPALHDLTVRGTGGLVLNSGSAERLSVDFSGTASTGCSLEAGTTLTDSVCWAHGASSGDALEAQEISGVTGTVTLRNDTLVSDNAGGSGLKGEARDSNSVLLLEATNVIARGMNEDVQAMTGGTGFRVVTVAMTNSSYEKIETEPLLTSITAPGTNGNQIAPPLFAGAAAGNFAEAASSPTVDAGLDNAANGSLGLAGEARVQPRCLGATPITDIGAFELAAVDCNPGSNGGSGGGAGTGGGSSKPGTAPAIANKIQFGKLTRNREKGTATLLVTVPGPGALTLSGKGVKKVSRRARAAGKLSLPIKAIGKARRKLTRSGSAKLELKLTFLPDGGTTGTGNRSVKLFRR